MTLSYLLRNHRFITHQRWSTLFYFFPWQSNGSQVSLGSACVFCLPGIGASHSRVPICLTLVEDSGMAPSANINTTGSPISSVLGAFCKHFPGFLGASQCRCGSWTKEASSLRDNNNPMGLCWALELCCGHTVRP